MISRTGGIFDYYCIANLLLSIAVKEFWFENWSAFVSVSGKNVVALYSDMV